MDARAMDERLRRWSIAVGAAGIGHSWATDAERRHGRIVARFLVPDLARIDAGEIRTLRTVEGRRALRVRKRGPMGASHAAAISRGQRARLESMAGRPRPIIRRDPTEYAACSEPRCGWEWRGVSPEPRRAARAHVGETGHMVDLAWRASIRMERPSPAQGPGARRSISG